MLRRRAGDASAAIGTDFNYPLPLAQWGNINLHWPT
jgi:hypothetical protein